MLRLNADRAAATQDPGSSHQHSKPPPTPAASRDTGRLFRTIGSHLARLGMAAALVQSQTPDQGTRGHTTRHLK
jgi:hypothetical protein